MAAPIHVPSIYIRQRRIFGSPLRRDTLLFDSLAIAVAVIVEGILVADATPLFFEPRFSGCRTPFRSARRRRAGQRDVPAGLR
ncbi:MAG: hypothetical protein ACQGVK_06375 [Myxococcota bacterium]